MDTTNYDYFVSWITKRLDLLGYNDCARNDEGNLSIISFISGEGPKTLSVIKNSQFLHENQKIEHEKHESNPVHMLN
jgi:hypothetical protein